MIRISVSHAQFDANLRRYAANSRNGIEAAVTRKLRAVMRRVIQITPPASAQVFGTEAKKQGEAAIDRDVSRLFEISRNRRNRKNLSAMIAIHRNFRRRERIPDLNEKFQVRSSDYKALARMLKKRVGWLASGWNSAVDRLSVRGIPVWIRNKSGQSQCTFIVRGWRYKFFASNDVKYVNGIRGIQRRIQFAMMAEAESMEREYQAFLRSRRTRL